MGSLFLMTTITATANITVSRRFALGIPLLTTTSRYLLEGQQAVDSSALT
jgi:hypothetical protein